MLAQMPLLRRFRVADRHRYFLQGMFEAITIKCCASSKVRKLHQIGIARGMSLRIIQALRTHHQTHDYLRHAETNNSVGPIIACSAALMGNGGGATRDCEDSPTDAQNQKGGVCPANRIQPNDRLSGEGQVRASKVRLTL